MPITAFYPGTFDPITNGHLDIMERSSRLFDRLIIGIAASARKSPAFTLEQRTELVKQAVKHLANVEVLPFSGLAIDFARRHSAQVMVRGLRAAADFDYELQLVGMNRHLAPEIETIFLAPSEQSAFISATIVREVLMMGGDIQAFVPPAVASALKSMKY